MSVSPWLAGADVFFGSLLFDFDQVEWLQEAVAKVGRCKLTVSNPC